jgi:hypothetical protein
MTDELADMWKSENLINHQVINSLDMETIKKLSEILDKVR